MSSKIVRIILLASLLLVLIMFFLYRGINWPLGAQSIDAFVAFALLLAINGALFLYDRSSLHSDTFYQKGMLSGLLIGLLWVAEISMNNILTPGLPARDILDNLFWAAVALIILGVSIQSSYQSNNIEVGMKVGFWSGLSSGAVACLTGLLFVVAGMPLLLRDPLNIAEWSVRGATSGTPDMAVYFAYQTLTGAILHLVILGALMGIVLGVIGGVLGKAGRLPGKKTPANNASL